METADRLIHGLDRLLNLALILVLLVILLYAGYALWDSYSVLNKANVTDEVLHYKPDQSDASNPSLAELQGINADACAWLTVDDTNIDYPVLRGDTNSKYLNIDIYGVYSLGGSVFLDYRSSGDFTDRYSLIYGHHMAGGMMFGDLEQFAEKTFFDKHATGWLYLPGRTCKLEIIAFLEVDAYKSPLFDLPLADGGLDVLTNHIEQDATYCRGTDLTDQDQILALSTCAEGTTNGRMILVTRMIETEQAGGED
mgnify:CR=1 FL=1